MFIKKTWYSKRTDCRLERWANISLFNILRVMHCRCKLSNRIQDLHLSRFWRLTFICHSSVWLTLLYHSWVPIVLLWGTERSWKRLHLCWYIIKRFNLQLFFLLQNRQIVLGLYYFPRRCCRVRLLLACLPLLTVLHHDEPQAANEVTAIVFAVKAC